MYNYTINSLLVYLFDIATGVELPATTPTQPVLMLRVTI